MNSANRSIGRAGFILVVLLAVVGAGCRSGMGTARSAKEISRLEARAEKGSARQQFELGQIFGSGDSVPRDDRAAFRWFRLAAEQGHAEAQYNVGLMYKDGRGVEKDFIQAYKWFNLSAARGNDNAAMRMDAIARLMSRDQVVDAQRQAAAFVPRKAPAP
jgi:TPR repeat protein